MGALHRASCHGKRSVGFRVEGWVLGLRELWVKGVSELWVRGFRLGGLRVLGSGTSVQG